MSVGEGARRCLGQAVRAVAAAADGRWAQQGDPACRQQHDPSAADRRRAGPRLRDRRRDADPADALRGHAQMRRRRAVQSLPAKFDASAFEVEQRFATSKDGTKRALFPRPQERRRGPGADADPRLWRVPRRADAGYLTGQPYRAGPLGLFWVEQGNAYVLANIRGGGEYGPEWHEAALREKRQNSFDDLHAVAEDLIAHRRRRQGQDRDFRPVERRRAASARRSTSGPTSIRRAIIGSPLVGHEALFAPARRRVVGRRIWRPRQARAVGVSLQIFALSEHAEGRPLSAGFIYGSTKDDRVHPGHARKAAARFIEYGNRVYFHEYMEGGHSVGADHAEDAKRSAMLLMYLDRELGGRRCRRSGPASAAASSAQPQPEDGDEHEQVHVGDRREARRAVQRVDAVADPEDDPAR